MVEGRLDEKALNGVFAVVLSGCNRVAEIEAERTGRLLSGGAGRGGQPDVVVAHPGRERVLVENKYDDKPERLLAGQCESRLGLRWADDGSPVRAVVGLRTPHRVASAADPVEAVEAASDFQWAAWTADAGRLPGSGWISGNVSELAGFIARVGVEAADVDGLTDGVRQALKAVGGLLGVDSAAARGFGEVLLQEPCAQTNRMAMAVMFNAVVFQSHIARHHKAVPSAAQMLSSGWLTQLAVLEEWARILDIDYWPIFGISRELLLSVSDEALAARMVGGLYRAAAEVAPAPGSQGLIGRILGELVGDRKFLATFYTLPSSAALLAEMAVERLELDWSDPDAVTSLRVGDLACGTGALLTAAYQRICERHLLAGGDPADIHRGLLGRGDDRLRHHAGGGSPDSGETLRGVPRHRLHGYQDMGDALRAHSRCRRGQRSHKTRGVGLAAHHQRCSVVG